MDDLAYSISIVRVTLMALGTKLLGPGGVQAACAYDERKCDVVYNAMPQIYSWMIVEITFEHIFKPPLSTV